MKKNLFILSLSLAAGLLSPGPAMAQNSTLGEGQATSNQPDALETPENNEEGVDASSQLGMEDEGFGTDETSLGEEQAEVSTEELTDLVPLNFCALAPKPDRSGFQKQRVILLDVAEDPSMDAAPEYELVKQGDKKVREAVSVVQGMGAFEHAREVLMTALPMQRHYWVTSKATPDAAFSETDAISDAQLNDLFDEDPFALYSAGCADWLVAPFMSRGDVVWTKVKREKTVDGKNVTDLVWEVSVPILMYAKLYQRSANGFEFIDIIEEEKSPFGRVVGATADSLPWNQPEVVAESLSVGLPQTCVLPTDNREAADFGSCGGVVLDFKVEGVAAPGARQASTSYCQDVDDRVSAGATARAKLARCSLRRATENGTAHLQINAKKKCGWRLYSALLPAKGPSGKGISMGKHEGARRGDFYVAHEAGSGCQQGRKTGFGRVTKVGPGGEEGYKDTSPMRFRAGNPDLGSYMLEFPMFGVRAGLEANAAYFLGKGDLASDLAFGGSVRLGWDLTRYLAWFDETWLVANTTLLFGGEQERFIDLDGGLEAAHYMGGHLAFITGAGVGLSSVSKRVVEGVNGGDDISLSGSVLAAQGRLGLDLALRPDWNLRLVAEGRFGLGTAELTNEEELPGVTLDGGGLHHATGGFSVGHTF